MSGPSREATGPTGPTGLDLDRLRAEFDAHTYSRFPPTVLVWHAALPEWTQGLAERLRHPAWRDGAGPAAIEDLVAADLATTRAAITDDGSVELAFWLPPSRRAAVGAHLQKTLGYSGILTQLSELRAALRSLSPVPPGLAASLDVLIGLQSDGSGRWLLTRLEEHLAAGASEAATELVRCAAALGALAGEPLTSTARRLQWRLDRAYRESIDTRALSRYQSRAELEGAVLGLLDDERQWALHLLGDGGVGKTMTIRYLASGELWRRRRQEAPAVARVDFDHIDPRYPTTRPAELLALLSAGLAGFTSSRASQYSRRALDDAIFAVHEVTSSGDPARQHPSPGEDDLLGRAVEAFADYVHSLGRRTVLVLDTCEELAKLYAPGSRSPALDRTFEILEQIHELSPDVRVLLAGRRWLVPGPAERSAGLVLSPRPYLRVVRVQGFTPAEALSYAQSRDEAGHLDPAVTHAVIERCTAPRDGVNPFALSCYLEWALGDPSVTAEAIADAVGDPYIEQRIIARIADPAVLAALPAAVELGRFDLPMIQAELVRRAADPDEAFSGLVAQEWVSTVTFDADGRPGVVEIDGNLLPRLRAVVAAEPGRFAIDGVVLGEDLARLSLRSPTLESVSSESIEAAVRLLPPGTAGRWWGQLEQRIVRESAWGWAGQVTPRAAAVELARSGQDGPTILAAVRATQAGVALRQPERPGVLALWSDAERLAGRHPDPDVGGRLRLRAACGAAVAQSRPSLPDVLALLRQDPPVDAALALVEQLPRASGWDEAGLGAHDPAPRPGPDPAGVLLELDRRADRGTGVATADAVLVTGISRALVQLAGGEAGAAEATITATLAAATALGAGDTSLGATTAAGPDWEPARGLVHRARRVAVVAHHALGRPPAAQVRDAWAGAARELPEDRDARALLATMIDAVTDWNPEQGVAVPRPASTGPGEVPQPEVALARAQAAAGDLGAATRVLHRLREAALSHGEASRAAAECDAALARLARQARNPRVTSTLDDVARSGSAPARSDAWAALYLSLGETPRDPADAGGAHSYFQVTGRPSASAGSAGSAVKALAEVVADEVDALEHGGPRSGWSTTRRLLDQLRLDPDPPPVVLLDRTGWVLGACVRASALLAADDAVRAGTPGANDAAAYALDALNLERLPPYLLGEVALAEGELLVLRRADAGIRLLRIAGQAFLRAGAGAAAARVAVLIELTDRRTSPGRPGSALRPKELQGWPVWEAMAGSAVHEGSSGPPELRLMTRQPPPVPQTAAPTAQGYAGSWSPAGGPGGAPTPPNEPVLSPPPMTAGLRRRGRWLAVGIAVALPVLLLAALVPEAGVGLGRLGRAAALLLAVGSAVAVTGLARRLLPSPAGLVRSVRVLHERVWRVPRALRRGGSALWLVVERTSGTSRLPGVLDPTPKGIVAFSRLDPPDPAAAPVGPAPNLVVLLDLTGADRERVGTRGAAAGKDVGPDDLVLRIFDRGASAEGHEVAGDQQALSGVTIESRWDRRRAAVPERAEVTPAFLGPAELDPRAAEQRATSSKGGLLHMIGTPVPTSSGFRMRVRVDAPGSEAYVARSTTEGEILVGIDQLDCGLLDLLIVQAEPSETYSEPLAQSGPGTADLTRQALLVGAHTVLVVPPLPDREARQFGERVARVTQYARPTPAAVIALAREAWTLARRTAPPGAQERPEADVTVTASLSSRTLTFLSTSVSAT